MCKLNPPIETDLKSNTLQMYWDELSFFSTPGLTRWAFNQIVEDCILERDGWVNTDISNSEFILKCKKSINGEHKADISRMYHCRGTSKSNLVAASFIKQILDKYIYRWNPNYSFIDSIYKWRASHGSE